MTYLIDTHILIWSLSDTQRLKADVLHIIENKNVQIFVSVVSLWEIAIKMNSGKLRFDGGFPELLRLVQEKDFTVLPIKNNHMKKLFELPFYHRDPFDRLLIAAAMVENVPLLTADENIHQYDVQWIW